MFSSLLKDMIKAVDGQPDEEIHTQGKVWEGPEHGSICLPGTGVSFSQCLDVFPNLEAPLSLCFRNFTEASYTGAIDH